jgi:hypothetical protein
MYHEGTNLFDTKDIRRHYGGTTEIHPVCQQPFGNHHAKRHTPAYPLTPIKTKYLHNNPPCRPTIILTPF